MSNILYNKILYFIIAIRLELRYDPVYKYDIIFMTWV